MLFVGHTRFSLFNPQSSSWKATGGRFATADEYRDYLYDPARLDARCDIFLGQSLPMIAEAARDFDILHVVSYSDSLPPEYQRRLECAAMQYRFLRLDRQTPGRQSIDVHELAQESLAPIESVQVYGVYRLDDDDLLSADYFQQMGAHLRPDNAGSQVTLSRGLTALYSNGKFSNLREAYWPMLAIGLLSVCSIGPDGQIVQPIFAPHHLSDRFNPVISDARSVSYLWVRHVEQDTALDYDAEATEAAVLTSMSRYQAAPAGTDFRALFPHAAPWHAPREEELLVTPEVLQAPRQLDFDTAASTFDLTVDAEYGADVVESNGLISFGLITDDDSEPDESALRRAGIAKSTSPAIGFFRYLRTEPTRGETTYSVALPPGVRCSSVTIMRFKKQDTAVTLHSVIASVSQ